ncbi:uncharacterized protein LOC125665316 [Ostrea edulis]|uniref:uncharacterized protein LOC125665316 n=1 Tax=Ostrea edulis TaxID=37623 RepID=UPI002095745B|nr:uncharacterized protein LOC125665316 [Ostrea edulis]
MKVNTISEEPISLNGTNIEDVTNFPYLGSKITTDGDSEADVQARISKATGAYAALRNIWRSTKFSTNTKIKIFKSNVLGVLLYGAESWKVTKSISNKLDVFQTRCLRRILRIFWPNTISNDELYKRTNTTPLSQTIRKRKWLWIGHVCRMYPNSIPRVALKWSPTGKRKRGRPRETWRRSVEKEMKDNNWSWGQVQKWAKDRPTWKSLVTALCADKHEED